MEEAFLEDWSLTLSDAIDPVALLNKIIEKNTLNLFKVLPFQNDSQPEPKKTDLGKLWAGQMHPCVF